jgi:hypothetical protein
MKILTEAQLEKLTPERLLAIRRKLTPALGANTHYDDGVYMYEGVPREELPEWLRELQEFDERLRRVMAKRPHVPRKGKATR